MLVPVCGLYKGFIFLLLFLELKNPGAAHTRNNTVYMSPYILKRLLFLKCSFTKFETKVATGKTRKTGNQPGNLMTRGKKGKSGNFAKRRNIGEFLLNYIILD